MGLPYSTVGVMFLFLLSQTPGAEITQSPSGDEILRRVEEQLSGVHDYTVTLDVTVDLKGLNVQPMTVTMYFKQPDKVHFVADQFAMLPREGLSMSVGQLRLRYTAEGVREDTLAGKRVWSLAMKSRADRTKLREITAQVDAERWTIERLESRLLDGRAMTATFSYEQVNSFLLPSRMEVSFASRSSDTTSVSPLFDEPSSPHGRRIPLTGSVVIRYSNYRVNQGLSDELFSSPEVKAN